MTDGRAAPARRDRDIATVAVATLGFGLALVLKERVDPWLATALAAGTATVLACWSLGLPRLRPLCAIEPRAALAASLLGVALVVATHVGFGVVERILPGLAAHIRLLYATVDVGASRAWLAALTAFVVVGEELVWRGVAMDLTRRASPVVRGAVSVGLYVLPQLVGGEPILIVAAVVLGVVCAAQRLRSGRLTEAMLTHAIWSVAVFVLFPLPGQHAGN